MRLTLYQPEIPQNTGALLRLAACLGIGVDIIEPCGFLLSDRRFRRAGMDYIQHVDLVRHSSWQAFCHSSFLPSPRFILLTPHTEKSYLDFCFEPHDILIIGQESRGVPENITQGIPNHIKIPMRAEARSLNMAMAAAMVIGEALRQTQLFP